MKFAVEIGIFLVLAGLVGYLAGLISLTQMFIFTGIFGYGTVQALRELFLAKSQLTRIVTVVGVLLTAIFGYGTIVGLPWATVEKLGLLLAVVFGVQLTALGLGIARSGGKSILNE